MIFIVSKDLKSVEKNEQKGFQSMNLWERKHIEEWVRKAPEILGEDLLVVSVEFDQFSVSRDRLDILAVDREGKLVVVELKRDPSAGYADLQALRYAAMVSSMTIESLAPHYLAYLRKYMKEDDVTLEAAKDRILEFVEDEDFEELSTKPRVILCSEDFSREVTTTALWLRQFGVDISCVRFSPYLVEDKVVIIPTKIIPLPEAEEYQVKIQKKQEESRQGNGKKRARTMQILLDNGIIKGGERVYLKSSLPSHLHYKEGDPTFTGVLTGKRGQRNAIVWDKDQKEYSISMLAWMIFRDTHPDKKDPGGVNGSAHWVLKNGKALWTLAEEALAKQQKSLLDAKPVK